MKNGKKITAFALCLLCVLSPLTSCGKKEAEDPIETKETTAAPASGTAETEAHEPSVPTYDESETMPPLVTGDSVSATDYKIIRADLSSAGTKSVASNMYKMLTGLSDNTAKITLSYGETPVTGTVSELFGDNLEYTLPEKENATFIGWATTADATEAAIDSATALTYEAVKDLLTEGEVTLYPVFENVTYDLVVYVWLGNSDYNITEEESAAMKAAFEATHADVKVNWVNVFGEKAAGFATAAAGGNADVVIGAKNMGSLTIVADGSDGAKVSAGAGWCADTSRYVAVVSGHETNNLAIELWTLISTAKA